MFNALNRFISRLDGDGPQRDSNSSTHGQFGFQVLRNNNLELKVDPWFDFVIGINGRMIDSPDPRLFAQEVRNCAGGNVTLGLWSAKGQRTRALQIPVSAEAPTLGLTLQWTPLSAVSNIWHVLDVPANSPADQAGLLPYSDYILGSPDGELHGESGLGELVEDHIGRPLRVWVYNNEYDVTRELTIQPSRGWGGQGALGCVLGYGALHRLPAPLSEPVSAPGETMFDGAEQYGPPLVSDGTNIFVPAAAASSDAAPPPSVHDPAQQTGADFFVPAAQLAASPVTGAQAPPPPRGRKKDKHHHHGGGGGGGGKGMMDDYFKEQEAKSKALDNAPSGRVTPVAPPPRAGSSGPPRAGAAVPPPPLASASDAGESGQAD